MSRRVVVIEEVECDLKCSSHGGEIENLEWIWNGVELEIDVCEKGGKRLEKGEVSFMEVHNASRPKMHACPDCGKEFKSPQGVSTHRTRAHGKDSTS